VHIAKRQKYHFAIFAPPKSRFFDAKLPNARKKRRNSGVDKTRFVSNLFQIAVTSNKLGVTS
jgi:hypothetical protein